MNKTLANTPVLCFLICLIISSCEEKKPQSPSPNILFLIADDWSYPHAGIYGDPVVRTPTFDRLAKEGALFTNAYATSPSCSPSRASILLGRYPHQNEAGGNLWSEFPPNYPTYVGLLEKAGYFTGSTRKGWGPGEYEISGFNHNPAGKNFDEFDAFLKKGTTSSLLSFGLEAVIPIGNMLPIPVYKPE